LLVDEGVLSPHRPGIIVAGAGAGAGGAEAVMTLSAVLGWPVLADPRSRLRGLDTGVIGTADGILRSSRFVGDHPAQTVLHLGERWASSVVNSYVSACAASGAAIVVVDPWERWTDPDREATTLVRADPTLFCEEAVKCVTAAVGSSTPGGTRPGRTSPSGGGWLSAWQRAEDGARGVIGTMGGGDLAADLPAGALDEPSLAQRLFARIPAEATLVVSSSMPVRDMEAFGLPRHRPPKVLANRGANGIDGVMSTALGVALASGGPTVALVGDLAFFHDVSALVRSHDLAADLTVVVADNAGGGIFSFLAPATVLDETSFDRLFGTPQSPDPAAVATGFGWSVDDLGPGAVAGDFDRALDRRLGEGGMSVIRVRLPGRTENVAVHDRINAEIVRAVDG
jgi:2-succinyl-5-enolpyruvyl-6-hydroxy-3-cyclohexene-1-carboxylate synthase